MYDRLPTVATPEELLDAALGKAAKIHKEDPDLRYRIKKTITTRMEAASDRLTGRVESYVKAFPNLDRVSTYERELLDVVVGVERLRRSLARLQGALETLQRVTSEALREVRRTTDPARLKAAHRRLVGRMASIVEDLRHPLAFLAHVRAVLREIPDVTPEDPTVVLAGYPNVGKSSLLARLSRARPEIAPYAYTTKRINVGHYTWPEGAGRRGTRIQLVDTPGLLEKPPSQRNAIEKQAALALGYLADLILFVLDPTESCGYTRPEQERFLASARKEFAQVPILVVATKADLGGDAPGTLRVSGTTGEGVAELKAGIARALPPDPYRGVLGETSPQLRGE